jgi:exodeoxyribonuclease V beta subunit
MSKALDVKDQPLDNGLFVEASAGTGKTFSIAALIVRELATNSQLSISEILVTTFTRNAAAELRDRVRRRIVNTARSLKAGTNDDGDPIVELLAKGSDSDIDQFYRNLMRALLEFDTATIATIHSVCSKIIALAGKSGTGADENDQDRIISEVVNDQLVMQAAIDARIPQDRVIKVVKRKLGEPLTRLWFDPSVDPALMARVLQVIEDSVKGVLAHLEENPSFDYLIRTAADIVRNGGSAIADEFRARYRYLIVDEAQDTDAQQWAIFRGLFPEGPTESGSLIAVGDPKQSIYKFRGADIDAYAEARNEGLTRSLETNYRSDQGVVDGLNGLFAHTEFGSGIGYQNVDVPKKHAQSQVSNLSPVEILQAADISDQGELAVVTARRVLDYLQADNQIVDDRTGEWRDIQPSDIVVLVKSGSVGRGIENELRRLRVPAVSAGTASVMDSEAAEHWRILLRALARPSDDGRVRHLLGTPIFGVDLSSPAVTDDNYISWAQEIVANWGILLRQSGVAVLAGEILSDSARVSSLSSGLSGERRLTDFTHMVDLLNGETRGVGCTPDDALEAFAHLSSVDATSETVARRVESDLDAVQIMTIHVSKGLEFPIVVVSDLWKKEIPYKKNDVPVFRLSAEHDQCDTDGNPIMGRVIDIGWVVDSVSPIGDVQRDFEAVDEASRLLYVAATRAEHHVCIVHATKGGDSVIDDRLDAHVLENGIDGIVRVVQADVSSSSIKFDPKTTKKKKKVVLQVADSSQKVEQTYRRTSFTGITNDQSGGQESHPRLEALPGHDEGAKVFERRVGYAKKSTPAGVPEMPLALIPGGTHIGTILHEVYEKIDPAHDDLESHVASIVKRKVSGKLFDDHGKNIIKGVTLTLKTPLGGPLGSKTLAQLGTTHRAAEMSFEMSLAHLTEGVEVRDIGVLLKEMLPVGDPLTAYADLLCDKSFEIPLAGLINGSIDALLRLVETDGSFMLFISDYKSNRLDRDGDVQLIDAYSAERMLQEMEHHHYPLQAIIYGVAVYRFLRWRSPEINADEVVRGFAYMFIRGMVGENTPVDDFGNCSGVYTWQAPQGFWTRLSALFAGDRP